MALRALPFWPGISDAVVQHQDAYGVVFGPGASIIPGAKIQKSFPGGGPAKALY